MQDDRSGTHPDTPHRPADDRIRIPWLERRGIATATEHPPPTPPRVRDASGLDAAAPRIRADVGVAAGLELGQYGAHGNAA
jgi:hypothetical protein